MGRSHLRHETQSTRPTGDTLTPTPQQELSPHRLLLDLTLPPESLHGNQNWLRAGRTLLEHLLPDALQTNRQITLSSYDRLSTALTVAQVCGVQRVSRHYAARLAPQPGPEASRASNRRLAQITEFARLLASQPTLIAPRSRSLLREAGLTEPDIVHLVLICAMVSIQARLVAAATAITHCTQRVTPAAAPLYDPASPLLAPGGHWRSDVHPHPHRDRLTVATAPGRPTPIPRALRPLLRTLAFDAPALNALNQMATALNQASRHADSDWPPELIAYSVHGSGHCLNQLLREGDYRADFIAALRGGQPGIDRWIARHSRQGPWIEALRTLALTPDRVTSTLLAIPHYAASSTFPPYVLLARAAYASGICRLKTGLGHVE